MQILNKSLCIMIFLAVCVSTTALGQRDPAAMKGRMESQKTEMLEALGLSDETRPLVSDILDQSIEKRLALMSQRSAGTPGGGIRDKMQTIDIETEKQLAEILTEDQMTIYKEKARNGRRGQRRGPQSGRIN